MIDFGLSPEISPKKETQTQLVIPSTEVMMEVVVIYPFVAEASDEMSLDFGQVLVVYACSGRKGNTQDDQWWYGEHTKSGAAGWFPASFVQKR